MGWRESSKAAKGGARAGRVAGPKKPSSKLRVKEKAENYQWKTHVHCSCPTVLFLFYGTSTAGFGFQ
jgi:hypothetical protein